MRLFLFTFCFSFLATLGFAQSLQSLEPELSFELDFSSESISRFLSSEAFEACSKVFKKVNAEDRNEFTIEEQKILFYCDETKDEIWYIQGGGCSWYCGGGPKKVEASSFLISQGSNTYEPDNAHDLHYRTAWVEGEKGYGIGEYLEYTFEGASPRINEIKIINGYVKSKAVWLNNSRVKTLKMYIDDKPYAILNLKDFYGKQTFRVKPIGNSNRTNLELLKTKPDWKLKFEIIDIYKGLKYDDVAITEIYFSGLDVHCFAKGTKIQLSDNKTINIEELKVGYSIAYLDFSENKIKSARIEKLEKAIHHELITYHFESGLQITATKDHPFKIKNKSWASLLPLKSSQYKGFDEIEKIKINDLFLTHEGTEKLILIEYLFGPQETLTIAKTSEGDNFIANGLIVGLEELQEMTH